MTEAEIELGIRLIETDLFLITLKEDQLIEDKIMGVIQEDLTVTAADLVEVKLEVFPIHQDILREGVYSNT